MVKTLASRRLPAEVLGGGSKRAVGRPVNAEALITTTGLRGITLYEPAELVMQARAGTALAQIETELASRGQMLAWEPVDLGPVTGAAAGRQTIGAVFAANLSGARRVRAGAARDHLLGITAVNGKGELFHAGGRVMKNVTGYDLARGLAGSWGTLAVLTDVTFKVLPMPEEQAALLFFGLPDETGIELLSAALMTPFEVSGAVHLPAAMAGRLQMKELAAEGQAITAVRVESFATPVAYRAERLATALKVYGAALVLDTADSARLWEELRRLSVLPPGPTALWRISLPPVAGPAFVAAVRRTMAADAFYDWGGGLVWLEVPPSADAGAADIRRMLAPFGGHATLIRAEPAVRAAVEIFHPMDPVAERLTRGLKRAFDPESIFNPGRMYSYI